MKRALGTPALALSVLLMVAGCNDDRNPAPTSPSLRDTLEVTSVVPASGATITCDQTIHIDALLHYEFATVSGGRLAVVILAGAGGSLAYVDAGNLQNLTSPRGDVPVTLAIRLPASAGGGNLAIRFNLVPEGASAQSAQAGVDYPIASITTSSHPAAPPLS